MGRRVEEEEMDPFSPILPSRTFGYHLKFLMHLHVLDLDEMFMSVNDVNVLIYGCQDNSSLHYLKISDVEFEDGMVCVEKFAQLLSKSDSIYRLQYPAAPSRMITWNASSDHLLCA